MRLSEEEVQKFNEVVKLRALLRELRPVLLYHNEHFLVQKCDAAVESPPE